MDIELLKLETKLKEKYLNSADDLIRYVLFEMQSPIEDYFLAIDLLAENYPRSRDIRIAILGAYLSSTWLNFKENKFLRLLKPHLANASNQNKAIIYYLYAYDIYMKYDNKYPPEYSEQLRTSIMYAKRFVYNYVRLAEITNKQEASSLLTQAIANVETVRNETQLKDISPDLFLKYDFFIDEFILGVDISIYEYNDLLAKKQQLRHLKKS